MVDSYGDGNVYRGHVCKDSEIKTIEINKYDADVERLVEAANRAAKWLATYPGENANKAYTQLKTAIEPFKGVK